MKTKSRTKLKKNDLVTLRSGGLPFKVAGVTKTHAILIFRTRRSKESKGFHPATRVHRYEVPRKLLKKVS